MGPKLRETRKDNGADLPAKYLKVEKKKNRSESRSTKQGFQRAVSNDR